MDIVVEYWHWILGGLTLIGVELLLFPGSFFLWIGLTAILIGLLTFAFPLSLGMQLLIFSPLALAITWYGKSLIKKNMTSDAPLLNRRADQLIGLTFVLSAPIKDGIAQAKVGDSVWQVNGPDLPKGTKVIVTEIQGNTLIVEAKEDS